MCLSWYFSEYASLSLCKSTFLPGKLLLIGQIFKGGFSNKLPVLGWSPIRVLPQPMYPPPLVNIPLTSATCSCFFLFQQTWTSGQGWGWGREQR